MYNARDYSVASATFGPALTTIHRHDLREHDVEITDHGLKELKPRLVQMWSAKNE
jgi:hypothetical protein